MSNPGGAGSAATVRRWAIVAVVAQIAFVLSCLLAGFWQGPRYSWLDHTISDMYAVGAPRGMFLVVVLTLAGAAVSGFALFSLGPVLRGGGRGAGAGPVLLALSIFGLGDLLTPFERENCRLADTGCTTADQIANLGGKLDGILSTIGLLAAVAACFFIGATMSHLPEWQSSARTTRWTGVVLIVLLLATGLGGAVGLGGLFERLLATAGAAAIAALAWAVFRRPELAAG